MSPAYRAILKFARISHLYLTLFGLTLILLFAVSGFMLNHIDWFVLDDPPARTEPVRTLPLTKFPNQEFPQFGNSPELTGEQKLALVETLRKEFKLAGELTNLQVTTSEDEDSKPVLKLEFRRAGETVLVTVDEQASTQVTHKFKGWMGVLTDLHRGNRGNSPEDPKFTGMVWSVVIDATAVLLLFISVTGLVLWSSLKTRGKAGAVLILLGGVITFAVYYWFTP
jgi:uncharacterized protein